MGYHVTKLISVHSFHTKNILSKFHQNLINQIQDILKSVYFGTKNMAQFGPKWWACPGKNR